jgi:hypothetical protein
MSAPQPPSTPRSRISESTVANVLANAIWVGLAAFAAWLWLHIQQFFQFIVIPANLLTAIGFIALGVFLALVVIAVLLYVGLLRVMSKSPVVVLLLVLGMALALAVHDPAARDRMIDKLNEPLQPKP